ncbi:CDGSH iron-sulfur domain-containing protein 3, mitochondrial-like [Biomphalaria glabrata]|uniref:CDGSH iron-sulfur domain-containing protein 3, mitochondrial-like n=2 Tax=Biomphalaria TaxID=6525 RepID=A0A2C9KA58_BIOGL|nr:CDGSH iron-sulfur domain-containing protein 3, mitochondrial-like [Biomphalaria glabrata]KAI8789299.1 CDGSH iron-sulfur domain-containing protein 3, mitochondrial [Biomphalaria glabrata]KAK0047142.1 CDGSH iron-sulfur domain-containing protein 3 mitochondrial [Biomphalaria pfeifferi]
MATTLHKLFRVHNRILTYQPQSVNSNVLRFISLTRQNADSEDPNDPKVAEMLKKPHPETITKHHPDLLSPEPVKGKIFEKLPIRLELEAGKKYTFCTCGYSKTQPFCDTSHKAPNFMSTRPHHIRYRPMSFEVTETKEYWLCMCKQSNKRPFCDGTHKRQDIQDAVKS